MAALRRAEYHGAAGVMSSHGAASAAGLLCLVALVFTARRIAITDKGISACFEFGFGVGNSVEVDPRGGLDEGVSLEGKLSAKLAIVKADVGFTLGECRDLKPKLEACVGPLCEKVTGLDNLGNELLKPKGKGSLEETDGITKGKNPFKGSGLAVTGKLTGKICQKAEW